jgi:DNA-binding Lrp family transcriptional regulator
LGSPRIENSIRTTDRQPPTPKIEGENKQMPTAFILLNTEIGAENHVLLALKKIEGVQEAHNLWGVYDIIAHLEAESMEKLKYIITKRIEKIGKINSKLTMIINEKNRAPTQEQMFFEPVPIIQ